jgi:hypothetical protein
MNRFAQLSGTFISAELTITTDGAREHPALQWTNATPPAARHRSMKSKAGSRTPSNSFVSGTSSSATTTRSSSAARSSGSSGSAPGTSDSTCVHPCARSVNGSAAASHEPTSSHGRTTPICKSGLVSTTNPAYRTRVSTDLNRRVLCPGTAHAERTEQVNLPTSTLNSCTTIRSMDCDEIPVLASIHGPHASSWAADQLFRICQQGSH